jgi:uncharacterized lipoprotein NlpE involved in copper resistance
MKHALLFVALLALAGCNRTEPTAPPPPPPPPAPAAAAPAAPPPPKAPAAAPAISGDFAGTLPCADCGGIATELHFAADGSYQLKETLVGKAGAAPHEEKGAWSASDDGRLQLANEDSENARYFAIVSPDEIRLLDSTGNPIPDKAKNYSLKRVAAASP